MVFNLSTDFLSANFFRLLLENKLLCEKETLFAKTLTITKLFNYFIQIQMRSVFHQFWKYFDSLTIYSTSRWFIKHCCFEYFCSVTNILVRLVSGWTFTYFWVIWLLISIFVENKSGTACSNTAPLVSMTARLWTITEKDVVSELTPFYKMQILKMKLLRTFHKRRKHITISDTLIPRNTGSPICFHLYEMCKSFKLGGIMFKIKRFSTIE